MTVLAQSEPPPPEPVQGSAVIFGNALGDGWEDDSADATPTAVNGHLEVSFDVALGELRFNTDKFDTTGYNLLSFYIRPNDADEPLYVHLYDEYGQETAHLYVPLYSLGDQLYPYIWQEVHIPLSNLNATNRVVKGIGFQHDDAETLLLDELRFNLRTDNDGDDCNE